MEPGPKDKLKQQISALRSSNRSVILETIKDLRSDGDVSVLPELFNLLLIQEDAEIQGQISALLNDLKEQEAAEILALAIADPEFEQIQATLLAACWQNGLSYSRHLKVFVEVLVKGTYPAAIEAFTVIEEAVGELEPKEREKFLADLKSHASGLDDQKKALYVEMVRVIENYGNAS
jgi:hypothetical protein